MNIYTSHFQNHEKVPHPIAISVRVPAYFDGPRYALLSPTPELEKSYYQGEIDEGKYVQLFMDLLKSRGVTVGQVLRDLPFSCTLLCWEGPYQFCHRHIVARWIQDRAGIEITEHGTKFIKAGLGIS